MDRAGCQGLPKAKKGKKEKKKTARTRYKNMYK